MELLHMVSIVCGSVQILEVSLVFSIVLILSARAVDDCDDCDVYIYSCASLYPELEMSPSFLLNKSTTVNVEFENCSNDTHSCDVCLYQTFPVGLFAYANSVTKLIINAPISNFPLLNRITNATFQGLEELEELYLKGFERVKTLDADIFLPLSNLKLLSLSDFGSIEMSYSTLSVALHGLSGTSLQRLEFSGIHGVNNIEQVDLTFVNIQQLFGIPGVDVKYLSFDNSVVPGVSGQLSVVLPSLVYLRFSLSAQYTSSLSFVFDAVVLHENLEEIQFYSFPKGTVSSLAYSKDRLKYPSVDIFLKLIQYPNNSCFWRYEFPLSSSLKSLTFNGFSFLGSTLTGTVCFHSPNNLEYLDLSDCQLPPNLPLFSGVTNLRSLNVSNTGIQTISPSQFQLSSNLETLVLNGNYNLRFSAITDNMQIDRNNRLMNIDLSSCRIDFIPLKLFSNCFFLKRLDLSLNNLRVLDVSLENSSNFTWLNLSANLIETFSNETMKSFTYTKSPLLTIDLSQNNLHCLCNSTNFVNWIQTNQQINFEGYNDYTCLYPNGSQILLINVDILDLKRRCSVIEEITNNTQCPCDDEKIQRLNEVRASLYQYFCRYRSDLPLTQMSNLLKPGCPDVNNTFTSPAFLVPLIGGFCLIVVLVIIFVVVYRRRKSSIVPDPNQILSCWDVNRLVGTMMAILFRKTEQSESRQFDFDAFLYSQDDYQTIARSILSELPADLKMITTWDNFRIGAIKVEAIEESIQSSSSIVFVLSQSFVDDGWCREVLIRASRRQHSIIPVLVESLQVDDDDYLLSNLLKTNSPLVWSTDIPDQQTSVVEALVNRIKNLRVV